MLTEYLIVRYWLTFREILFFSLISEIIHSVTWVHMKFAFQKKKKKIEN